MFEATLTIGWGWAIMALVGVAAGGFWLADYLAHRRVERAWLLADEWREDAIRLAAQLDDLQRQWRGEASRGSVLEVLGEGQPEDPPTMGATG